MAHGHSAHMQRQIDSAKRTIDAAMASDVPGGWRVALSGGKDSTALGMLLHEHGLKMGALSSKDDLDYPCERPYTDVFCEHFGFKLDVLTPDISLIAFMKENERSLVAPTHSRNDELSAKHFYGLLDKYREREKHDGVFLGLRQDESKARKMNRVTHGRLYQRKFDGLHVCAPISDWSADDVHAYVWTRDWFLLPNYLCVDVDQDWRSIRIAWFIAGGGPARMQGHYTWLKRWWPDLWRIACDIDPEVALISAG